MLLGAFGSSKSNSLMGDYAVLLGDAVLRHRARLAEHSARIEAELASKVKSEFIANMSHELRTPLNTVIGFSKLLMEHDKRPLPPGDVVEYANLINAAAGHLLAVINDILDISKIQSGKYTLDYREVNMEEILLACISQHRNIATDAGVTIMPAIAFDLPVVRGDAAKLRQIFSNLLSNAVKFTASGGRVTVEALRTKEHGVAVLIRDTGIGMSQEEIALASKPFGQVDAGRTRWRDGTGLGLPIAKALVELHGGQMDIRSKRDIGTEVAIVFPDRNSVQPVSPAAAANMHSHLA